MIIKRTLEKKNKLLAIDVKGKHVIYDKLLQGEDISDDEYVQCKSIEFSEALERLVKLVNSERIKEDEISDVLVKGKKDLVALNDMRNRIIHKGNRILKYCVLDSFMVENILPIIDKLLELPDFASYSSLKEKPYIETNNIIRCLVEEGKKTTRDFSMIAFLKSMGAALLSPKKSDINTKNLEKLYKDNLLKMHEEYYRIGPAGKCPACGHDTLLREYGIEMLYDELGDAEDPSSNFEVIEIPDLIQDNVFCINCCFRIGTYVKNVEEYGYTKEDIEFWEDATSLRYYPPSN